MGLLYKKYQSGGVNVNSKFQSTRYDKEMKKNPSKFEYIKKDQFGNLIQNTPEEIKQAQIKNKPYVGTDMDSNVLIIGAESKGAKAKY